MYVFRFIDRVPLMVGVSAVRLGSRGLMRSSGCVATLSLPLRSSRRPRCRSCRSGRRTRFARIPSDESPSFA
jgi:hypothetical protein